MASIKMGAIVTDIKGKLGGHVFQKGNQSRVMKTNAKSRRTDNAVVRSAQVRVNNIVALWEQQTLTVQNRWDVLAKTFTFKNRFGDVNAYTGRQFFLYLNNNAVKGSHGTPVAINPLNTIVQVGTMTTAVINRTTSALVFTGSAPFSQQNYSYNVLVLNKPTNFPRHEKSVFWDVMNSMNTSQAPAYTRFVARYGIPQSSAIVYIFYRSINLSGFPTAYRWIQASIV